MKSPVVKRSIVVAGHKTSVSLEEAFWNGMKEISTARGLTLSELVAEIDSAPPSRQPVLGHSAVRAGLLPFAIGPGGEIAARSTADALNHPKTPKPETSKPAERAFFNFSSCEN